VVAGQGLRAACGQSANGLATGYLARWLRCGRRGYIAHSVVCPKFWTQYYPGRIEVVVNFRLQ
jgi:hypothetical protein